MSDHAREGDPDEEILLEQQGKGYGEDEGEREEALTEPESSPQESEQA